MERGAGLLGFVLESPGYLSRAAEDPGASLGGTLTSTTLGSPLASREQAGCCRRQDACHVQSWEWVLEALTLLGSDGSVLASPRWGP